MSADSHRLAAIAWLLLVGAGAACAPGGTVDAADDVLVIRNVTVIPVDGGDVLAGGDVIVRGHIIEAVGVGLPVPRGARVIDGQGKFLIPGLFEMHAHTSKTRASALGLYVANGVTTVRDVGGDHEELLRWRGEASTW